MLSEIIIMVNVPKNLSIHFKLSKKLNLSIYIKSHSSHCMAWHAVDITKHKKCFIQYFTGKLKKNQYFLIKN